jgi:hypothetical protein
MLKRLIDRLLEMGQERIIIIDNGSTYDPLIQYYREIEKNFEILRISENYGHDVMKKLFADPIIIEKYQLNLNNFIYTDCDVIPADECPKDFIQKFNEILRKYQIVKVGFSLHIDDLPDSFEAKQGLIRWESQFWKDKIHDQDIDIDLYPAAIDTTFACQRANEKSVWTNASFRTGPPYIAHHLPWYIDSNNLSEEDHNYIRTAGEFETHFPGRYKKEPD